MPLFTEGIATLFRQFSPGAFAVLTVGPTKSRDDDGLKIQLETIVKSEKCSPYTWRYGYSALVRVWNPNGRKRRQARWTFLQLNWETGIRRKHFTNATVIL